MLDLLMAFIVATLYMGFGCILMAALDEKPYFICILLWPVILVGGLFFGFLNGCLRIGKSIRIEREAKKEKGKTNETDKTV